MADAPLPPGQAPPGPGIGALLPPLLNTVALVGAMGLLYFVKVMYKRPEITEHGERTRLEQLHASPTPPPIPGTLDFERITVNLDGGPSIVQGKSKLHYATIAFAVELRDLNKKEQIEAVRPIVMDSVLSMVGRKTFSELASVQGKYLLRMQLLEMINKTVVERERAKQQEASGKVTRASRADESPATNLYFTEVIVQ